MGDLWWVVWVLGFFVLEVRGLWKRDDKWMPLTYYVRRVFNLQRSFGAGWWVVAGFVSWLGYHFLVES